MKNNIGEGKLRFAVMVKKQGLQKWQKETYESLINSGLAENVLWIVEDEVAVHWGLLKKIKNYPWSKFVFRQYYKNFMKPDSFERISLVDLKGNIPDLTCYTLKKGKFSEYFSAGDLKIIRSYHPDFILKFGFGITRGEILTCPKYGVWSFHHGDEQKYRGVPPGFNEIRQRDPITASILQRLTDKLDGGVILRKGYFNTIKHSWAANLQQALKLSAGWPTEVCREIISQNTFPATLEGVKTNAPIYREPDNITMISFLFRQWMNKVRFHLNEIFLSEHWETGLVKISPQDILEQPEYRVDANSVQWLGTKHRDRYWADSFALEEEGKLILLFENYDYKKRKASISACEYDKEEESFGNIVESLTEDWHLSYPFVFRHGDGVFCIPESLAHGSVELYKLDTETLKLTHIRTFIEGLEAADGTLLNHMNRWYFFFTPPHATNSELNIYHADSLEGPFLPHLLNPVKSDVRNARPAGPLFTLDDKLYRPAQDSSITYGGQVIINEVKILTEGEFLEEPVNVVLPPKGYSGLHTLSFAGDYLFFDCKKHSFSPASFRHQIKRRFKRNSN